MEPKEIWLLVMYSFTALIVVIFFYGFYRKYRLTKLGQKESRTDRLGERIRSFIVYGILQKRVGREAFPGVFHSFIFWGFVFLFLTTGIVFVQSRGLYILYGDSCNYVTLLADLTGILVIIGILFAAYRRFVRKPSRLNRKRDDTVVLTLIFLIVLTGFLTEGVRILNGDPGPLCRTAPGFQPEDDSMWSPVGSAFAWFFLAVGAEGEILWSVFWWMHLALALAFILYIPYSKLSHMFISPLNTFFRSLRPRGALKKMEIEEEAETFGVQKIEQFTSKQLWDLYACMECGRCQDNCPAWLTDKPLSPKKIILDLRDHLNVRGKELLMKSGEGLEVPSLGGSVVKFDEIWACTTCGACQESCPVFIEHIDKIVDMRRAMVMMESNFP
ncbi:MAG: 4Fe-4S dicluster domain-containing protein, partial [Thermoplasmata archaeon]